MPEFFVVANSGAAPMVSDQSTHYVDAPSPESALEHLTSTYSHPFGLFSAAAYYSADDFHKGRHPASRWFSNAALKQRAERATAPGMFVR